MNLENRICIPAGFWIRLFARIIDFIILLIITNAILFICLINKNGEWVFRYNWLFYIWSLILAFGILGLFVLLPICNQGRSIGQAICRIKTISLDGNLKHAIIQKEMFFGIAWTIMVLIVMIVINHTLILQLSHRVWNPKNAPKLSVGEKTRISVVGTLSSFLIFIQIFLAVTIIPNKNKQGFHDKISNSLTIKKETMKMFKKEKEINKVLPKKIRNEAIEWV